MSDTNKNGLVTGDCRKLQTWRQLLSWVSNIWAELFLSLLVMTQEEEWGKDAPGKGESMTPGNAQSLSVMIAFRCAWIKIPLSFTPIHRNVLSPFHQLAHGFSLITSGVWSWLLQSDQKLSHCLYAYGWLHRNRCMTAYTYIRRHKREKWI